MLPQDVINCSNISSCDLQRHLLGESTDGNSDEDDKCIDQKVAFPVVVDLQQPLLQPTLDAHPAPDNCSHRAALTTIASAPAPVVDEFYNIAGKALHPNSIIQKVESG